MYYCVKCILLRSLESVLGQVDLCLVVICLVAYSDSAREGVSLYFQRCMRFHTALCNAPSDCVTSYGHINNKTRVTCLVSHRQIARQDTYPQWKLKEYMTRWAEKASPSSIATFEKLAFHRSCDTSKMFKESRDDYERPVRKLSKRPEGIIHQAASRRGSIVHERPIAKIRKDRPRNIAQINNGIPRDLHEKEWKIPQLQNWNWSMVVPNDAPTLGESESNVEFKSPAPVILRNERKPTPILNETSSKNSHRRSLTEGSFSWPRPPGRRSEPPMPSKTEEHLAQIPVLKLNQFYQNRDVKDILTGPENYSWWAMNKKRQFIDSNLWLVISEDQSPVPGTSYYHVHRHNLFKETWFGILESVSPEIRQILNADWHGNPRGAWLYLERTYASVSATTLCSMRGVRGMLDLKYEDCASLTDFLGLMVQYSRAIQCNQQGKQGTEWLWCQFILMKLGPKWAPWVADLMDGIEKTEGPLDSLVDTHRLVEVLLNEDEERRQAKFQRRTTAGKDGKERFPLI